MTKQEYELQLKELQDRHAIERVQLERRQSLELATLMRKQLAELNHYKVGDNFTDHMGTIRIDQIKNTSSISAGPDAAFFGPILNKKGDAKLKRNGMFHTRWAYLSNDVNKKGE